MGFNEIERDAKFLYIDMRYCTIKWDGEGQMSQTKIYSLHFASITNSALLEDLKPELRVFYIWNFSNEKELLEEYNKIFIKYPATRIRVGVLDMAEIFILNGKCRQLVNQEKESFYNYNGKKPILLDLESQTFGYKKLKSPELVTDEQRKKKQILEL